MQYLDFHTFFTTEVLHPRLLVVYDVDSAAPRIKHVNTRVNPSSARLSEIVHGALLLSLVAACVIVAAGLLATRSRCAARPWQPCTRVGAAAAVSKRASVI